MTPRPHLPLRRARAVAAVIGLATGVNIVTSGMAANPGTSLFLVPDLIVVALLLAAAATPTARARPVLLVATGTATGVFTTAAMAYALRGEVGWGVTAFAVIVATTAALLAAGSPSMIDTRSAAGPAGPGRA
ncbi:hypothetical protein [Pseudonocardia kunmingensis]|uniref:Uncharacterized protein n=1 Tax=Pseudonocardia kunmingensis TaxID=630975 RepID=A0A543DK69_9PSEU|nr:hypothetical protein [Pseudonocardia kunmingensis]TQM09726.1 hypothetical protein FB558_5493 [Pseudonocardia kunmingensis]